MADRVAVAIRIGGSLSPVLPPAFCAAIESDGACIDWEGTPFDSNVLDQGAFLYLADLDGAWVNSRQSSVSVSIIISCLPAGQAARRVDSAPSGLSSMGCAFAALPHRMTTSS